MTRRPPPSTGSSSFALYAAAVLSLAMLLFPPFTSLYGIEYAFALTGPEWARGAEVGLSAHLHWTLLAVQLAAVWALALGARHFLRAPRRAHPPAGPALALGCLTLLLVAAPAAAQTPAETEGDQTRVRVEFDQVVGAQAGKFGIGTGSSWPAYGLSGTYRYSDQITAELILGMLGVVQSFAGRGWYRFNQDPTYDLYGFAAAGVFRYDYDTLGPNFRVIDDTETVLGLGGGVGVEVSWAKILDRPDFPPIYSNLDIGLMLANFDHYNWSGFSVGGGIHYRFGGK